ncbi:MAG: hypothetical protein NC429_00930 [Lachnospiraceae bacterium]|nr:hypothetical protein [Lachnospiraceae bacterium]
MNKTYRKSKKAKIICLFMSAVILTGVIGITSKAQTERRASNIKSKGVFDYADGTVVMDSSDLTYLADEIDLLEDTYKKETVKALNKMNTYFMLDDSTTHNPDESNLASDSASILPFHSIIEGILESQSIPTEKTYTGTVPGNENEVTGNISAATEDSLSLGDAAWVDGELVVGNGGDNNVYYNQGYADGMAKKENASLVYNYHQHTGSSTEGTGCYTKPEYEYNKGECHVYISGCIGGSTTDSNGFMTCNYTEGHTNCGRGTIYLSYHPHRESEHIGSSEYKHEYVISSEITGYSINCGKTESTIESATIVFK